MKVLLIGSGGREHALAYKIAESKSLSKLFIAPGNPGTASCGENVNLDISDFEAIVRFCEKEQIEFVCVGPEQPLVDGIVDYLGEKGIPAFGPGKLAARLEGDKAFSKNLMKKYGIPTAGYEIFNSTEIEVARNYVSKCDLPVVVKASGLAAGKGVLICTTREEALQAIDACMMNKRFGDSGEKVVVEEFMRGQEASIFAITDGENYFLLPSSQDHKRIFDNDLGPNTGGMGAYSPAPIVTNEVMAEIENNIIKPTIAAMKQEGHPYKGCLYCGIMLTDDGPKVVEFNCRFGDPETQAVLPLLEGDFLRLLFTSAVPEIDKTSVEIKQGNCITVIAASEGYPDAYKKGFEISGLDLISEKGIMVFHAGTTEKDGKLYNSGGRVLGVSAIKENATLAETKAAVYHSIQKISFKGMYYRKDIADKAIE